MDANVIQNLQQIADAVLGAGSVVVSAEARREQAFDVADGVVVDRLGPDGEPVTVLVESVRIKVGRGTSCAFDTARGKGVSPDQRTPLTPAEIEAEFRRQLGCFVKEHHDRKVLAELPPDERERVLATRRKIHLARARDLNVARAAEIAATQAAADATLPAPVDLGHDTDHLLDKAVELGAMTPDEAEAVRAQRKGG